MTKENPYGPNYQQFCFIVSRRNDTILNQIYARNAECPPPDLKLQ